MTFKVGDKVVMISGEQSREYYVLDINIAKNLILIDFEENYGCRWVPADNYRLSK